MVVFERVQFAIRLHKAILRKIHRLIAIADHAHNEVINRPFPLPDQQIERLRIAV